MAENNALTDIDFRALLDRAPRLFMLVDFDGVIRYWNWGGQELLGYEPDEMVGRQVWSLYPDRGEDVFREDLELIRSGQTLSAIFRSRHKNGDHHWVDVKRRLFTDGSDREWILASASDVSRYVHTERELERSEQRMKAIIDHTVEGIITIDTRGAIQSFNSSAEEIFGYEEREVLGRNVKVLMPQPYRGEHDGYMENYLRTGEKRIIGIGREVRGRRKDGSVFPMELSVSEIRFEDERLFTGLVKDISQRRQLENEILQVSEHERQRIGRDLHDGLGQMLTGIKLISQNLARRLKADGLPAADEVQEISDMIQEADQQAKALAHGLVAIELGAEGFREALARMCDRGESMFDITCHMELEEELEVTDRLMVTHMYRIVQEAMHNAVKHGQANTLWVRLYRSDGFLSLEIEDNGMGFARAAEKGDEKGIGVDTMDHRAHIMGGRLEIGESPGGRTQVRVTVPLAELRLTSNEEA
ncbi:MAG: PAS domain S-box protein [Balneolaceae bacterium]|nr:PAS domain S-box protein [Balneolaceae bacterium]